MAAVEPSYHGGDGDTDPPRCPTRVLQRCKSDFFEYKDLDDDCDDLAHVRDGILRIAADIYSNWKSDLNEHFRLIGGDKNAFHLVKPRSKVPNEMDAATWGRCYDLFDYPEFRVSV
ncbi:hypothetical protein TorRG33x02_345980 [Trema orientale]|uniref:Uncharacterized protein n=1 Tax=Trema orientale TaxID=63057 RepID=A0A2P5ANC0_TREOI|nr:hypothetical protein TorRG33x02_345980 [Trema orientale]